SPAPCCQSPLSCRPSGRSELDIPGPAGGHSGGIPGREVGPGRPMDHQSRKGEPMQLTDGQKRYFETFGYLVFPGLLAGAVGWISEEFEAVWRDRGVSHDGTKRSCIVPFIDQRERLCALLDQPEVEGIVD